MINMTIKITANLTNAHKMVQIQTFQLQTRLVMYSILGMYRIAILTGYRIVGDRIRPDTGYRIQKTLRIAREFDVNNAIINKL